MKFRAQQSPPFAYLLNLLCPGLGHLFFGDFLFGLFIYLIMLLASAIVFISLFVPLNSLAQTILFGLPAVFYIFTFVDLSRSTSRRKTKNPRSGRSALFFLLFGLAYFLLAPNSPGNFLLRNLPDLFTVSDNNFSPYCRSGDLMVSNSLSFRANIVFVPEPVIFSLPERFDVVRARTEDGREVMAVVIGLPAEGVEIIEGVLVVDNTPLMVSPPDLPELQGSWPLTTASGRSILIATLRLGVIDQVYEVSITDIVGRVSKLI